jgi:hypothetical protein
MTQTDDNTLRNYLQLMSRYERLMEISRQLNSTLDVMNLLNKIIDAATELTRTEQASILLIDPTTLHSILESEHWGNGIGRCADGR